MDSFFFFVILEFTSSRICFAKLGSFASWALQDGVASRKRGSCLKNNVIPQFTNLARGDFYEARELHGVKG